MTNSHFHTQLKEALSLLENLSQFPQWQQLCDDARETGNCTLADAFEAVEVAAQHEMFSTDLDDLDFDPMEVALSQPLSDEERQVIKDGYDLVYSEGEDL